MCPLLFLLLRFIVLNVIFQISSDNDDDDEDESDDADTNTENTTDSDEVEEDSDDDDDSDDEDDSDPVYSIKQLQESYPYLNWLDYINALLPPGLNVTEDEPVVNTSPQFFQRLAAVMNTTSERTMANYIVWRAVYSAYKLQTFESGWWRLRPILSNEIQFKHLLVFRQGSSREMYQFDIKNVSFKLRSKINFCKAYLPSLLPFSKVANISTPSNRGY